MGGQAHNNNFQNAQKCGPRGYDPPPQHSDWPKMVKFYRNDHFIAWMDPKTDNKQQKHDFVICPPILKNSQNVKIYKSISAL